MRIQVVFNSTPILVPCGDGNLTVGELIQKAILRFKKVTEKHPDDVIEVRSLRLADTGSFVDQDDDVAEVLEDREVVILDYEYIPHYDVHESEGVGVASVSDDSPLTPSSQPFSPITLSGDTPNSAHYRRQQNHTHSEGYGTAESGITEQQYDGDRERREGREERERRQSERVLDESMIDDGSHTMDSSVRNIDMDDPEPDEEEVVLEEGGDVVGNEVGGRDSSLGHLPNIDASQDTELVITGGEWESRGEGRGVPSQGEPESPHLTSRKATWSQVDSGYAPKSQESFSHSQPKSLEAYSTSQELSLQEGGTLSGGAGEYPREFPNLTPTQNEGANKRAGAPPEKKQEGSNLRGSQRGSEYGGRGQKKTSPYSRVQRGNDGNFMMPPSHSGGGAGGRPSDFGGYQFDRGQHRGGGGDIGRGGRDHYGSGYPGGPRDHYRDIYGNSSYGDHDGYRGHHGNDFDRNSHSDWRRSYAGGEFDHMSPFSGGRSGMYGDIHHGDHMRSSGRYGDRGGRFVTRRDRLMEEARIFRAKSHERVDHMGGGGGGARGSYRPDDEFREPPVDHYLSQPTTPHFPYDARLSGFGLAPTTAMSFLHPGGGGGGYDPRQAMAGPSGYSLSQPVSYLGPRPLHGHQDYERVRLVPLMERDHRGGSQRLRLGGDERRDRTYSLDEEYDDDDDLDRKDRRGNQSQMNPFKRDFRKSIFRDGAVFSSWMDRVHEYGIEDGDDDNTVPLFEGDNISQSRQQTPSPQPHTKQRGDEDSEDEDEFGNVHIIELHKGEEPLGVHLTHFTAPDGSDLGVFIGAMDENGFAAKSEKLKINDRILACNGMDFTKEPFRSQVEELFLDMVAKEPLLRMAVSRGLTLCLEGLDQDDGEREGGGDVAMVAAATPSTSSKAEGEEIRRKERISERKPDTANVASPNTVTNTRLIGVKHTIQITRGSRGYGFGIASRDVTTDNKNTPIYVKNIVHEGPAFQDGRLRLGDRILMVDVTSVEGLSQPEVVQLLRESVGSITLVISRHEVVEKHEEDEFPSTSSPFSATSTASTEPTTVGKTVITLEIPLYDSGPAGLGVTVFGRSTLNNSNRHGDMGVFIKSVVPGGAAALDGRLCRGDQLLAINSQALLGKSNAEALDTLRKTLATATDSGSKIKLVVARKTGINKKRPGMAALEESPIEDEAEKGAEPTSNEVGIDIGAEALASQTSQSSQTGGVVVVNQQHQTSSSSSVGGGVTGGGGQTGLLNSQASQTSIGAGVVLSVDMETSQNNIDMEPRRGILRNSTTDSPGHSPKSSSNVSISHAHKSNTLPGYSSSSPVTSKRPSPSLTRRTQTNNTSQPSSPGLRKSYLPLKKTSPNAGRKLFSASGIIMGSGEFDRLEPRLDSMSDVGTHGSQGYGGGGSGSGILGMSSATHYGPMTWSPMMADGSSNVGEWGQGMVRTPSLNSDLSSIVGPQYPRYPGYMYPPPSHLHIPPNFQPSHPHYTPGYPPSTMDAMATNHAHPHHPRLHNGSYDQYTDGGYNLRGNDLGHHHGYDNHRWQQESQSSDILSMSYPGNDMMSNVSFSAITLSREQAPTRGSGRKERQKSDPNLLGSGGGGSSSEQSDIYHNSRSTSHTRSLTPPPPRSVEHHKGSLGDLRLSDSELSSFRRDDKGRISITKKTKKNPRQDFAHLTLSNPVPLLEGEAGLYRTGSDSCLPEAVERNAPGLLAGVEVGPSLGMVKSSSLESLHNMVAHKIKREVSGVGVQGVGLRRPAAIDHSLSHPSHGRGVPIPTFPGDLRAISFTKNPTAKKSQKKSLFKKVFKKKKGSKHKSSTKDKSSSSAAGGGGATSSMDYDTRSLEGDLEEEGERTDELPPHQRRHLDGYDSNDEILATIAKV